MKLQEIVLMNSWIDWSDEIEDIIFNQEYLIEKLKKSWSLNKSERLKLANAINIISLSN